jgi:hypothetical protein
MPLPEGNAYPICGYNLMSHPKQPTIAILLLDTEAGPQYFAANREILEALAAAFQQQAETMPRKPDPS